MENVEKSYNKLEWFFYIIFLPLLFTLLLTGVLLYFMGYNTLDTVLRWGNSIPLVEKVVPDPKLEENESSNSVGLLKEQLAASRETNLSHEQTISELKEEIKSKDEQIQQLEARVEELIVELEGKRTTEAERKEDIQRLANLYSTMSAKEAAPIIENLTLQEAVLIMDQMNAEAQSDIFAKMEPKRAAEISILLKETELNEDADIAQLQSRIDILVDELARKGTGLVTVDDLVETFSNMPSNSAALIIKEMMGTTPDKAIRIMSNVENPVRSQILAQLSADDPQLAARIARQLIE